MPFNLLALERLMEDLAVERLLMVLVTLAALNTLWKQLVSVNTLAQLPLSTLYLAILAMELQKLWLSKLFALKKKH